MTLAFSTHWPKHMGGGLTLFPEKIVESIKGIYDFYYYDYLDGEEPLGMKADDEWPSIEVVHPKKHTIRADNGNRWKEGSLIHPVINNRTPQRFQFAPTIKCKGVQKIEILHGLKRENHAFVKVDDKVLHQSEIEILAINDGFDSVEQFFQWFNTDFTGKIIHWTDLKY